VEENSLEDLTHFTAPDWPEEAGFRVWIANSSEEPVYDCAAFIQAEPAESVQFRGGLVAIPYGALTPDELIVGPGTLPPRDKVSFFIGKGLVKGLGDIRLHFTDVNERDWRRTRGTLTAVDNPEPRDRAENGPTPES
jgi:hypothetical protein